MHAGREVRKGPPSVRVSVAYVPPSLLGPCCPEFNSGGRTRTGFGVEVRPEVGLAQVRTFAKLLVTHGFRLKGPLFADSEYGLGSESGYGLEGGRVGRRR